MNRSTVSPAVNRPEAPPTLDDFWTLLILEWRRNGLAAPMGMAVDRFEKTNVTVTFGSSVDLSTWAKHFKEPTRIVDLPKGAGWLTWAEVSFHGYNVTLEFCLRTADILPEDAPVTDAEITGLAAYLPPQWISVATGEQVPA